MFFCFYLSFTSFLVSFKFSHTKFTKPYLGFYKWQMFTFLYTSLYFQSKTNFFYPQSLCSKSFRTNSWHYSLKPWNVCCHHNDRTGQSEVSSRWDHSEATDMLSGAHISTRTVMCLLGYCPWGCWFKGLVVSFQLFLWLYLELFILHFMLFNSNLCIYFLI